LAGLLYAFRSRPAVAAAPILIALGFLVLRGGGPAAAWIAIAVLGVSLARAAWRKTVRPWDAAVLLFFLMLATRQNRNIVNFAIVSLPFLAAGMTRLAAALPLPRSV